MCGIAGIWNFSEENLTEHKLKTFTDSLTHRGPDGFGYYIDGASNFGIGHRRLSILDLSAAGKQPMSFADERYWIAYNGEVYNFLELREELKIKGYAFRTETDTEVILAAYHCWGLEAFHKFNGMWAMAIWDTNEKKLLLSRDRFGVKPLYYTFIPDKIFAFASETIAFKYLENYKRSFNERNIILQLKDPDALEGKGHTIFENIYQLLPGHYSVIAKNKPCKQKRWWNTLENLQEVPPDYSAQVEKFRDLLISSTRLRLRSDVPVATALSGGIDSSAVFCSLNYMMKNTKSKERMPENWQQAFVATFPGTLSDEREYAEEVIRYTGLKGTYVELEDKDLARRIMETTVRSDSIIGSPLISSCMVYEAMKRSGFSVSMDGHGADEMLYGYPWLAKAASNYYESINETESKQDAQQIYIDLLNIDVKEEIKMQVGKEAVSGSLLKTLKKKARATPLHSFYTAVRKSFDVPLLPELSDKPYNTHKLNSAESILFDCFHTSTLPALLRNFDRASMQNSVEVRMPFMDWRLVVYVFSLPVGSKIGHGFTKRILRDAMKGLMPDRIRERKIKIGLMAPMYDWFNNQLSEMIIDEVNSSSFLNSSLWDGKELAAYAAKRSMTKKWEGREGSAFWTVFNAHLLLKNNSR